MRLTRSPGRAHAPACPRRTGRRARASGGGRPSVRRPRRRSRAPCSRRARRPAAVSATKRSIRPASSSGKASTSRNVSTCRSGSTRRCVSAIGLMSRIATNPSAACTWSPSATSRQNRQFSGGDGKDALLGDSDGARVQELADLAVDEPRRVVVAVAAARAGRRARGRSCRPSTAQRRRESSSESARSRALRSFFTAAGTVSAPAVAVPGRGEYGKTWTLRDPRALDDVERALERRARPRRGSRRSRPR